MNKKKDIIKKLLVSCIEDEPQYIVRSLQGKLRIGLAEKSVLTAIANAVVMTPPAQKDFPPKILDAKKSMSISSLHERIIEVAEMLKSVYSELPSYDVIIPILLEENGIEQLPKKCYITPGIPVHPMLAQPTKGVTEVLDRFSASSFTCEYKYDGERAQIHLKEDKTIQIYSRNLENNTQKFPDILVNLPLHIKEGVNSFIIDCEAVAWDKNLKKILPFQILSTRARKTVELKDVKVEVCLFVFDILYLNGKSLLKENLQTRRERLKESFIEHEDHLQFAKGKDCKDPEEVREFLEDAVKNDCEGLMVKTLLDNSSYEPSRRSFNWLKIKKDYLQGMTDTLDLVPIGAYFGKVFFQTKFFFLLCLLFFF